MCFTLSPLINYLIMEGGFYEVHNSTHSNSNITRKNH